MDRRLIDLELKGYEEELHRRNQTLDIPKAERMRYWLAGWKQSYAAAFESDEVDLDLTEAQCLARALDLKAYIEERERNEDLGTAEAFRNWLKAFMACYERATGQAPVDELAPDLEAERTETIAAPSPEDLLKMPWMARRASVARLTGRTPRNADDAKKIYRAWFAGHLAKTQAA